MRGMRRKDRQIEPAETEAPLESGEYGVLSTVDGDGQPYGVPVNYVYRDGAVYLHCALAGHKLDNIKSNPRVSFCVVGKTRVLPAEFATEYESAVIFGIASEPSGEERRQALEGLLEKYSPDFMNEGRDYIQRKDKVTKVVKINIRHVSGKARR
ncbi:MAG: pyridoxamine 5'-phosphate oxidase family protein [Acidobacteriota bacterium]